jgi:AcrR family transcriptional regulator
VGQAHKRQRSRMTSDERHAQLIDIVVGIVAEHGVQAATTRTIASTAGVTAPTLYRHFGDQEGMLIAALDSVFDQAEAVVCSSEDLDTPQRLRSIGTYKLMAGAPERTAFVHPIFQFIVGSQTPALRQRVRERQMGIIALVATIVDEGKASGQIRDDADSVWVAWQMTAVWWFEDVSMIMGLEAPLTTILDHMLDLIMSDLRRTTGPRVSS